MTDESPQDIGDFATEIFNDLAAELKSRLQQSLATYSEADRIAILTAISKAAWRGILRGVAVTTYAVNAKADTEQGENEGADVVRLDPQLSIGAEPDLWADEYGGES
jgi:hypothetical protein